jgi:uncharacterized protein YndB with AHSA1/START domain
MKTYKEARMSSVVEATVKKSITVNASVEHAFAVFTEGYDTWWPRSHHIGKSPMEKAIIETRRGGRCYTTQVDGTQYDWGQILKWDPPHRLVIAWQITPEWGYEPDLAKSSEVEITFTPTADGGTRVDLEHRHFERMGPGGATMRVGVDSAGGWGSLLQLFAVRAGQVLEKSR